MLKMERNQFYGKRCFVNASGPSLKNVDLSLLKNEIVICVNESYKVLPFEPTFICIGDYKLWPFVKESYAAMKNTIIFAGSGLNGTCGSDYTGDNLLPVVPLYKTKSIQQDGFQWDLEELYKGFNVIPEVVLPLVCYLGFSECYLLGCDHKQNGYAFDDPIRGKETQLIDPRIFDAYDKIASTPNKPTRIYNATQDSALKSFPFVELEKVLSGENVDTSDYIVVGYYTPGQDYKQRALQMKASVEAQGLHCEIFEYPDNFENGDILPDRMGWVLNCSMCAEFCFEMFQKFKDKHILYMDADAVMEQFPSLLFDSVMDSYDVSAPILTNKHVTNELVSNTLIFRRTPGALKVLKLWMEYTDNKIQKMLKGEMKPPYMDAWDQYTLRDAVKDSGCKFMPLPWEYAKITPTPKGEEIMPGIDPDKVVISQYQASRQNKFKVGK